MANINTSMTINFRGEVADSELRDLLIIEQLEWEDSTGKIKMSDFYNFTYSVLRSESYESPVSCGLDSGGNCVSTIYVYPKILGLSYKLHASYGDLSSRSVDSYDHQEIINFNIANVGTLQYSPSGNVSYSWVGSVYDNAGNVRSAPSVVIDESGVITLPEKVYGSLKIECVVQRHKYLLTVAPRSEGTDLFGSVVYGLYTGGISWLELTNPPDLDDIADGSYTCGGMSYDMSDDELDPNSPEEPPEDAPEVNRRIVYDYCSQLVISDETTYNGILPGQG